MESPGCPTPSKAMASVFPGREVEGGEGGAEGGAEEGYNIQLTEL